MSDEGMSDAEFDAKVGFPVGERYVPKSKLDAAEARALAAEANERARIVAHLSKDVARSEPTMDATWTAAFNAGIDYCALSIHRNEHGAGK